MVGPFDLESYDSKINCCGCKACESICPVNAISMVEDSEGFKYPFVDLELCTDCGLCESACPIINNKKNSQSEYAYACYSKDNDIRNNASSGGIFELLARDIIADGGVVFGAAFDEGLTLKHMYAQTVDDLKKLCKSKYVESDTNESFDKVKEFLQDNRKVLFTGTPCQVSALKNFLGKPFNNLLTVDFICHGVPSDKMFKSYIDSVEKKQGGKMKNFSFRVKDGNTKHVHGYSFTIDKNGRQKVRKGMFYENPYYFGFKKFLFLRPSCYSCKYATPERVSDITIADFWGIEDYLPNVDFNRGISMVLLNSDMGKAAFDNISGKIDKHEFGIDIAIKCNHCLSAPTKLPQRREAIMRDFGSLSFDEFAKQHILSKKKMIYKVYYALPVFLRKRLIKRFKGISYV